jgi:hypothetical protein
VLIGIPSGEVRKIDIKLKTRGGSSFEAYLDTSDVDMSEVNPMLRGIVKIISRIRVFYRNFGVTTNIIVSISTNGGATFPYSKMVGLAGGGSGGISGKLQIANVDIIATGENFRVRVKETGAGTSFAIDHLELQYAIGGDYIEWNDGGHLQ